MRFTANDRCDLAAGLRIIFIGLLVALGTLALEATHQAASAAVAATMGFAVFSLFNITLGLSCRYEKMSTFNRDILSDRRQLGLYGLALLLTFLPTELNFGQRILGLTSLTFNQWLLCIGCAVALLVVDEVVKFFLRRRRAEVPVEKAPALKPVVNP